MLEELRDAGILTRRRIRREAGADPAVKRMKR